MGSDRLLLFSSDYPHWQFDGDAVLPQRLPSDTIRKILMDNPRETYARLRDVRAGEGQKRQKEPS
jgi:predicted TIM-barrel fold metal-dependent hydrolase